MHTTTTTLPRALGLPPRLPPQGGWLLLLAGLSWPRRPPHPAWRPPAPWHLPTGLAFGGGADWGACAGGRGPCSLERRRIQHRAGCAQQHPKDALSKATPAVPPLPHRWVPAGQEVPPSKAPRAQARPAPTPFPQWEQTACPETQRTHAVWFAATGIRGCDSGVC